MRRLMRKVHYRWPHSSPSVRAIADRCLMSGEVASKPEISAGHRPPSAQGCTPRRVSAVSVSLPRTRRSFAGVGAANIGVFMGHMSIVSDARNNIVLPDGQTVGDWMRPQIAQSYDSGEIPPLLPGPESMP